MTGLRDRDEVGQSICGLLYDLVAPREVVFWHVASLEGIPHVVKTLHLARNPVQENVCSDMAVSLDSSPALKTCIGRKSVIVAEISEAGSVVYFPVLGKRGVIGVLEVCAHGPLQEGQTALVERLLQIYRNHLELLDYGELDGLTGLMNRKAFDDHFAHLMDDQRRFAAQSGFEGAERSCWLAVVDIDHFKTINDRFGHLLGDEVLALAARLMQQSFRRSDRVFRCGGEEFAVMLHNLTQEEADCSLQRFREQFACFRFPQVERVTVSVGYTRLSLTDNLPSAFGRADRALYFSKQNGRNAVNWYEVLLEESHLIDSKIELNDVEMF
jgi:diguanylate cyclase (GGDEF)-like protein